MNSKSQKVICCTIDSSNVILQIDTYRQCQKVTFHHHHRFGVCCLFITSTSGATVSQNCSYIQNPNFPSAYASETAISFTVTKCSSGICIFSYFSHLYLLVLVIFFFYIFRCMRIEIRFWDIYHSWTYRW